MPEPAPTFYIFHGEDELSRNEQLAKFKAQLGDPSVAAMNIATFDGSEVTLGELAAVSNTMPFMSERRLVIVEGLLESASGRAMLESLQEMLADLPDWARIVIVENKILRDDHPLLRFANKHPNGRAVPFKAPSDATGWIVKRASQYDAKIKGGAAKQLATLVGNNLRLADSEIAKLAAYTNGQRPITVEDIMLLTPYAAEIKIFDMVDALGERNGKKAAQLLQGLLSGAPNPGELLRLFGMMIRQFRLLITAKEFIESASGGNMAKELGLHPFVAKKMAGQARNFSLERLEEIYRQLIETDVAIKTGQIEARLALELLVTSLADT